MGGEVEGSEGPCAGCVWKPGVPEDSAAARCPLNEKGLKESHFRGFPGGAVVENLPANAGDTGSSPGLGGSHMPRSN